MKGKAREGKRITCKGNSVCQGPMARKSLTRNEGEAWPKYSKGGKREACKEPRDIDDSPM